MRRLAITLILLLVGSLASVPAAQAEFGLKEFDVSITNRDGSPALQAGSHPFALTTSEQVNVTTSPILGEVPDEQIKDLIIGQVSGLVGDPGATPRCSTLDFLTKAEPKFNGKTPDGIYTACPDSSAVGTALISLEEPAPSFGAAVYNLVPPPGAAAKIGFWAGTVPVTIELGVSEAPPYNVVATATEISQALPLFGSELTIWGDPADPAHDAFRGQCVFSGILTGLGSELLSNGNCPTSIDDVPFVTLPRACEGPLTTSYEADSWVHPGAWVGGSVFSHDGATPPNPQGFIGCSKLGFSPLIGARPTSKAASSPTGLDFSLDVADEGLTSPTGLAKSDIEKAVVTLPEGMSANPSIAEGLNVCTEEDLEAETAFSTPGAGCPNASKIGTVEVETPLLDENVNGSLFIAKPYENPFNSLLAMYLVIKNANLGIIVKQPLKVEPDPVTGQLTTVAEELPQLPFSHFKLHFREGARSPLTTPQACGTYDVQATLYPWAGGSPITTTSAFQIVTGPNEGPCPTGGLPPFKPGLIAGTINNRAGSFSPFNLRLFRSDSEQEITHFSIKLPPGIVGKLAGIPYCSDQAIEAAKARTGPHGGQEELDNPSCPAASEIGRTLAGAGVGPSLTYAPGKVYLAGPYHGSNLSMVAITAGKVGPFDIGTVVIREAFKIDPETAEVFVDSQGSDPIPHIVRGIPVHLRDIRAYVDRPEFVLNPTDCTATSTASTVLGSGLDFVSEADDNPITVSSRFQAADCAALSFAPQLSMKLTGGTRRAAFPKFSAHLAMNGIGESGIQSAQVTLPKSEYIANAHFVTICTRVQFKEGDGNGSACPAGSIYGHAKAVTPILGEPLEGPVFLRANGGERNLPDLVVALHNAQVNFDLVGFVDSAKGGGLRNTFVAAPDAPVSSFDIELEGGSKGLFENSVNLCAKKHFATADFVGQNGKAYNAKPVLQVKCKGKPRKHKRHAKRRHKRHAGR
jgi:hypothetical protein